METIPLGGRSSQTVYLENRTALWTLGGFHPALRTTIQALFCKKRRPLLTSFYPKCRETTLIMSCRASGICTLSMMREATGIWSMTKSYQCCTRPTKCWVLWTSNLTRVIFKSTLRIWTRIRTGGWLRRSLRCLFWRLWSAGTKMHKTLGRYKNLKRVF